MNAVEVAEGADLVYVTGEEPGFSRRRAGKGFFYLDEAGRKIGEPGTLARIRALAIPPAWNDVWICADPAGHIQATGRDQRRRKQYRYHPGWTACRDEAKFSSLAGFAGALPRLREQVDRDLRRRGLPCERMLASAVHLLDHTLIRIGNDAYAEANRSFGLTTLRNRHLRLDGTQLRFSFTGKSGQAWLLKLDDRRIAAVMRSAQELPGQRLLRYLDEDGAVHDIRSQDVNDYIRDAIGDGFSSKHFRTWGATVHAARSLVACDPPPAGRERRIVLNAAIDEVARLLHNTRAVCRRCYVHPAVIEAWDENRLRAEMRGLLGRPPLKGLDGGESAVLRWLRRRAA